MKPLALNKIRAEKDAKLDQLFNMGSGLKIFDYMEAANLLLTRTYPEIEDGSQSKPIFIPETYLPPTQLDIPKDAFFNLMRTMIQYTSCIYQLHVNRKDRGFEGYGSQTPNSW